MEFAENMIRLLSICSSHNRPAGLARMVKSYMDTRTDDRSRLIAYVFNDDLRMAEYAKIRFCDMIFGPYRTMPQVLNYVSSKVYPDIPYYQEVNDDHVYRTKGWDEILIGAIESRGGGVGLSCGKDLVDGPADNDWHKWEHPSAAVISGNIIRALGYFIYPAFLNIGIDDHFRDLFKEIDKLFYIPEVIIEHVHWVPKKVVFEKDPNYGFIYSKESVENGNKLFAEWKTNILPHVAATIRGIMQTKGDGHE